MFFIAARTVALHDSMYEEYYFFGRTILRSSAASSVILCTSMHSLQCCDSEIAIVASCFVYECQNCLKIIQFTRQRRSITAVWAPFFIISTFVGQAWASIVNSCGGSAYKSSERYYNAACEAQ